MSGIDGVRVVVADNRAGAGSGGRGRYQETGTGLDPGAGKLKALDQGTTKQIVATISELANELSGAPLPAGVEAVKISVGLALSGDFGVSIAGTGVEADIRVEITWNP